MSIWRRLKSMGEVLNQPIPKEVFRHPIRSLDEFLMGREDMQYKLSREEASEKIKEFLEDTLKYSSNTHVRLVLGRPQEYLDLGIIDLISELSKEKSNTIEIAEVSTIEKITEGKGKEEKTYEKHHYLLTDMLDELGDHVSVYQIENSNVTSHNHILAKKQDSSVPHRDLTSWSHINKKGKQHFTVMSGVQTRPNQGTYEGEWNMMSEYFKGKKIEKI